MGRTARGAKVIDLKRGDEATSVAVMESDDQSKPKQKD
jgi:hypothetical protein